LTMSFRKILIVFGAMTAFVFMAASPAPAAMGDIQSFTFNGYGPEDVLGPGEEAKPDGNPDANFSVTLTGAGAIAHFTITAPDGKVKWDTKAGNNIAGILVKDGKNEVISKSDQSLPVIPFILAASFNFSVHDDGTIAEGGKFTLTTIFIDGSESRASVEIPRTAKDEPEKTAEIKILSAKWNKDVARDLTGRNENLAGDGAPDESIRVAVQGSGKLTGVTVKSVKGGAEWDTLPGNKAWLVAVTAKDKVLNRKDGSVEADIKGKTVLDLWLTDNGVIKKGRSAFEVLLVFSDGSVIRREVDAEDERADDDDEEFEGRTVFLGQGDRDFTGQNEKKAGNGKPDLHAELVLETPGTVVAVAVQALSGNKGEWDTIPGNGNWLVVVTGKDGAILNRQDGSVSIPVSGKREFGLWFEDNGDFGGRQTRGRVSLTYDDGRVLTKEFSRAPEDGPKKKPGQNVHRERREVALSQPRQASSSDLVGRGERPGKSGKLDWVFEMQINGKGTIKSLALRGNSPFGWSEWDTIPGNGIPLLGAAPMGKGLLNAKNGAVMIEVPPHNKLLLFVEDDGFLARKGPKQFKLEVTWTDGTVTESN
jgi:hypothetical protein